MRGADVVAYHAERVVGRIVLLEGVENLVLSATQGAHVGGGAADNLPLCVGPFTAGRILCSFEHRIAGCGGVGGVDYVYAALLVAEVGYQQCAVGQCAGTEAGAADAEVPSSALVGSFGGGSEHGVVLHHAAFTGLDGEVRVAEER